MQRHIQYLQSINQEVRARMNRVRHLIGKAHWLSDGHHKEAVMSSVIDRYLVDGVKSCRAFLVNLDTDLCSKEQDIAILDKSKEFIFSSEDLVICSVESLISTISMKSEYSTTNLRNSFNNQCSVLEVFFSKYNRLEVPLFISFFLGDIKMSQDMYENIVNMVREEFVDKIRSICPVTRNAIEIKWLFCGLSGFVIELRYSKESNLVEVKWFNCDELSLSYGLAALCSRVAEVKGLNETGLSSFFDNMYIGRPEVSSLSLD